MCIKIKCYSRILIDSKWRGFCNRVTGCTLAKTHTSVHFTHSLFLVSFLPWTYDVNKTVYDYCAFNIYIIIVWLLVGINIFPTKKRSAFDDELNGSWDERVTVDSEPRSRSKMGIEQESSEWQAKALLLYYGNTYICLKLTNVFFFSLRFWGHS